MAGKVLDLTAEFSRDGVVCLRQVVSDPWLETLRRGLERNLVSPSEFSCRYTSDGAPGMFIDDYCNWQRIDEYRSFVFESPIGHVAATLLASREVRFFHEHVLVKEPGTKDISPWHHDQPYYCVDGEQVLSIWVPLDPVSRAVCPEFVAGSHRWGKLFAPKKFQDHGSYENALSAFDPVPDIDARRGELDILSWELAPGDAIAFHMKTVHGAPGTEASTHRRRAIAWRFLGDDARFAVRPFETSPPFPEVDLEVGAPMDHPSFPVVYSKGDGR